MAEYIEREALLERVRTHLTQDWKTIGKKQFSEGYYLGLSEAEIMVAQAITAEVEQVRHTTFKDGECMACGWFGDCVDTPHYNYCPGCGARADGGTDNGK